MLKFENEEREFKPNEICFVLWRNFKGELIPAMRVVNSYSGYGRYLLNGISVNKAKWIESYGDVKTISYDDKESLQEFWDNGVLYTKKYDDNNYQSYYTTEIFHTYHEAIEKAKEIKTENERRSAMSDEELMWEDVERVIKTAKLTDEQAEFCRNTFRQLDNIENADIRFVDYTVQYKPNWKDNTWINLIKVKKPVEILSSAKYFFRTWRLHDADEKTINKGWSNELPEVIFKKYVSDIHTRINITNKLWTEKIGIAEPYRLISGCKNVEGELVPTLIARFTNGKNDFDIHDYYGNNPHLTYFYVRSDNGKFSYSRLGIYVFGKTNRRAQEIRELIGNQIKKEFKEYYSFFEEDLKNCRVYTTIQAKCVDLK